MVLWISRDISKPFKYGLGFFFALSSHFSPASRDDLCEKNGQAGHLFNGGIDMDKRELAYAKQSALATPNWDIFQIVIRKVLKPIPVFSPPSPIS